MKAMVLEAVGRPLRLIEREMPRPGPGQVLVAIVACAVCRTDLHVIDGDLPHPKLPLVPGHEIVGRVTSVGDGEARFAEGDRVGIPWLGLPAGCVVIACQVARTCAMRQASRGTRSMGDTRPTP